MVDARVDIIQVKPDEENLLDEEGGLFIFSFW